MVCMNPGCLGNYDFDHIVYYARKRFIEGYSTVSLIAQAASQREKEEIALVCLLDVEDEKIKNLKLSCRHSDTCKVTSCRDRLKKMLESEMATIINMRA